MEIKLRRRSINNTVFLENTNIPKLLKRIYRQRGICTINELERSTKNLLSYHQLTNIDKAVELLVNAIENQYRLMIVGDFDVDGATSTALIMLSLKRMGAKIVNFIIPNRFWDEYGLSINIVKKAIKWGAHIIITVDNGISSHEGVILANKKNVLVLIIDHHIPSENLPPADAIINPNLNDCIFTSKSLAGVGVVFYLMIALRSKLNKNGWFLKKNIIFPKLAEFLDLVALGTIADLVSLDTNNRILVHQGLNRIRAGYCRPGIRALIEISNLNITRICASDLGFSIGPRLNAAGRLKNMSIGVKLLLTDHFSYARTLAIELNFLNEIRKKIEKNMEKEALILCEKIKKRKKLMPFGLAIYHPQWHQGIIGILASRIKDRFYRPVIAFAPSKNGILKGSGRSIDNLHIYDLLKKIDMLYPGMIIKFGGHAMAVGLILKKKYFHQFQKCFSKLIDELFDPIIFENIIWSDGELENRDISINTAELLYNSGPWGVGFPDPIFDGKFSILKQYLIGKKHLKLLLKPLSGGPILNGIAFNIDCKLWPDKNIRNIKIIYKLKINEFNNNKNLQLLIKHIWCL